MNVVAFSLYGTESLYLLGAIKNAEIISNQMRDWQAVFFVSKDLSPKIAKQLLSHNAKLVWEESDWHANGMFWRFQAFALPLVDRVVIRDVDSRITDRDLYVIREWCESGRAGHIVRDHPLHASLIMGGLWGAKKELLNDVEIWRAMNDFGVSKGQDQEFLNSHIYPIMATQSLIHDTFHLYEKHAKPIRFPRRGGEFLGEVIDQFEGYDQNSRQVVIDLEGTFLLLRLLKFFSKLTRNRARTLLYFYKLYSTASKKVLLRKSVGKLT